MHDKMRQETVSVLGFTTSCRIAVITLCIVLTTGIPSLAQQSDTTQTEKRLEPVQRELTQPYHTERSTNDFMLPSSGMYQTPEPTEYYTPPFMGQKHLDAAVEAYRKELEEGLGNSLLFQFISKIAPFVNNQFEFGVYRIYDLPLVDRDHPLRDPQLGPSTQEQ